MQQLDTDSLFKGKDEDARVLIAQRVGQSLTTEDLAQSDLRAAELLARALLDDAIERVRSEFSKAVRHAKHIPRDLALKLAHDVDSVSCPFLEVTEVFTDSDWQQLLLTISRGARVAVASRSQFSEGMVTMLAELSDSVVAQTLIENPAAPMTESVCDTLMERFASETWVLDRLALRDDLVRGIAIKLTTQVSAAIREKLASTYKLPGYTEPLADEAETGAILQIIKKAPDKDLVEIAKTLKKEGKLTSALIHKALKEGETPFMEAGLSVQSERSLEHVRSVIIRAGPDAVTQLLTRANIPVEMHDEFQEAFLILRQK
jgi:uncharacterized protein (DUF2336 family)